eukprot:GDKH01003537.1.p1 GENE.GDKH01003537.1~~GDKH01003537.1.p1  ORF type:complete len:257 (-),score=49.43 GDKH01003537.1:104-874(-)
MEVDQIESGKVLWKGRNNSDRITNAEVVLRRRNVDLAAAAERSQRQQENRKKFAKDRRGSIVLPFRLVNNWKLQRVDRLRAKRAKKAVKSPKDIEAHRVLLAVRNQRLPSTASKESKQELQALGLTALHTAVILPNTEQMRQKLVVVSPFVYYGYPSLQTVKNMFSKCANLRVKGQRTPLMDNAVIEDNMGELGMFCVEDVVDAVWRGGESAQSVLSHFWPFQLASLKKAEGLDAKDLEEGNIKSAINSKLEKVLG